MADYHLAGGVVPCSIVSPRNARTLQRLLQRPRAMPARFGDKAEGSAGETLRIVATTARELGIPVGENIKAMLDAHSVSFSGGRISLHDEDGIPLRGLGIGSTRLLIAGLQRKAAAQATIILIDELEHGLEPHRIIRLLRSLVRRKTDSPLQVFMTTHSPVVLRELSGDQLFVARPRDPNTRPDCCTADDIQSTIRLYLKLFSPHPSLCARRK